MASQEHNEASNYVFFWKPQEPEYGFLGNWYYSPFSAPPPAFDSTSTESPAPVDFINAEQYMMYSKAKLFDHPANENIASSILYTPDPQRQRELGREVQGFDERIWVANRKKIVEEALWHKFTQNDGLKQRLLATQNKILVQASPRDRIWGIGFGAKNALSRKGWGLNLLGKALMRVRDRILKDEANQTSKNAE